VLIVVVALTVSSVMVVGLRFLWFLTVLRRSAVVPHEVDDAAKQDSSVGSRADRFAASHHERRSCYTFGAGMSAEAKAYGWAAFFLVVAALSIAGGCWELTIARSAPART
jgi:hypothetical protein